jgi:hypothetical protein
MSSNALSKADHLQSKKHADRRRSMTTRVYSMATAFSPAKLAAMIEYLLRKGQYVYRTSLNKLLFYSDLSFFYLRGVGISGAVYNNRTFGPVTDAAERILNKLVADHRLAIDPRTRTIESRDDAATSNQILS